MRLLLQFAAVADCLSFTVAARRLGMGQPRLSAQIRKLEEQLGMALFERSTRHVRLTARGVELLDVVRPLADAAQQAVAHVGDMRHQAGALVSIGCPQLGAPDAMQAQLFARFMRDHPGLAMDVQPGLSVNHAEQLRKGEIDLALMSVLPEGAEWEALSLHRLALAAIFHRTDPLAVVEPLEARHFAGRRIAVFARRRAPELHERLYAELAAAGADLLEVPELRRSLLRDRPDLIVSTIIAAPAEARLPHDLIRREIVMQHEMRMSLVRQRATLRSGAAERFWNWTAREGAAA
ncbi:LysR substrate binding domain-containing protein [Sphingobium faniae]|nr:LysR substrate binding domain-containing protein [Sphingobium faniae]